MFGSFPCRARPEKDARSRGEGRTIRRRVLLKVHRLLGKKSRIPNIVLTCVAPRWLRFCVESVFPTAPFFTGSSKAVSSSLHLGRRGRSLRKKGAAPTHQSPRRLLRERKTRVGRTDTQTGMLPGVPGSTTCVQRFDDSRNSAIHITYRISLRSSSLREPRHPLLKVVHWFVCKGPASLKKERRPSQSF